MERQVYGVHALMLGATLLAAAGAVAADTANPSASDDAAHRFAIANALSLAAQVQARVTDYRQRHDGFPASNADAQVNTPAAIATQDVKSILVRDGGVVEVTLTGTSGVDDGRIVLTPTLAKNSDDRNVEWHCASPSYSTIADMTGGTCEYTKLP